MAINFPDSPTLNQVFSAAGRTWKWDGTTWVSVGAELVVADISDLTATATEINYTDGVTSAIQTQLNAQIPRSTVTTAGDLIVADGNASVTRLGIGTNGQVLSSNGTTATWATPAGMVQLGTTSISGDTSITGLSTSGYKKLIISVTGLTGGTRAYIGFGRGSIWAGNTTAIYKLGSGSTTTSGSETAGLSIAGLVTLSSGIQAGTFWVEMANVSLNQTRVIWGSCSMRNGASTTFTATGSACINENLEATSAHIVTQGNGTFTAGTMTVYGVN